MPIVTAAQNVKFNSTLDDVVVLSVDGTNRTVVLWNNLTTADKATVTELVTALGGDAPLAGPKAGVSNLGFGGTGLGANPTGLSNIATATAGVATINVGSNKSGVSLSGLVTGTGNSAGSQVVNFAPAVVGSNATGLTATVPATAGYQTVGVGSNKTLATATGLANTTAVYTATITVDGVARAISLVGNVAQTYTTLLSEINTDLAGSATASIVGGNIRVVSATTGALSTVSIVDTNLFSTLTGFTSLVTAVPGVNAIVTTYTATIVVDGVTRNISVVGSAALTFTTLIAEINTDLAGAATVVIAGEDLKVISATSGSTSTVIITDITLFAAVAGFAGLSAPQTGDGTATQYTALVEVDGVIKSVRFNGNAGATLTAVLSELNADLGASATASIGGGNIIITSATTGVTSTVKVYDTGFLFSTLTGYAGVSTVNGVAPTVYTAVVTVDGVDKAISIQGNTAQTFTTLVSGINIGLGASATASIVTGNVVITSATTGTASTVRVAGGTLLKSLTGFAKVGPDYSGAANLATVFATVRSPNGSRFSEAIPTVTVGLKPAVPAGTPHNTEFRYWGRTAGDPTDDWRYLDDNAII